MSALLMFCSTKSVHALIKAINTSHLTVAKRQFNFLSNFLMAEQAKESFKQLIDLKRLPQHIAITMDGNGRWAKQKGKKCK